MIMLHNRWFGLPASSRKNQLVRKFRPLMELLEDRLTPATITVTSAADTVAVNGAVTLREAILSINGGTAINADVHATGLYGTDDKIYFAIPNTGIHIIEPTSALPPLTRPVTISGYTQSGSSFNNDNLGDNATLDIVLNGVIAGAANNGLTVLADHCSILGLDIENFGNNGIEVKGTSALIQGNFIGTDAYGKASDGNAGAGIRLDAGNNTIGGPEPLERNLISGNVTGIYVPGGASQIVNNIIGLDASGQKKLGNQFVGVYLGSTGTTLGGTTPGTGNIISGNGGIGIVLFGSNNIVVGNLVGTDGIGENLGNGDLGILLNGNAANNVIGGTTPGEGNVIAFNCSNPPSGVSKAGIASDNTSTGTGNAFLGNIIYSNNGPAIDLNRDGATPNDPEDADTGFNGLQNYPVLNLAVDQKTGVAISGTFNSTPNASYRLEFYVNGSGSYAGFYIGSVQVFTDANGNAPVFFSTGNQLSIGTVSATATDSFESTSEFSPPVAVITSLGANATGFVSSVYLDMLHRLPDTAGATYFVNQINMGVPHAQVIQSIQNNSEYRGIVVTDLYNRLLNRAPDPLGLLGFSNALAQGATVEQVETMMISSDEFYQNRGFSNNGGFVLVAFDDLLGRLPDTGAQSYFAGLLDNNTPRNAVVQQLVGSQEGSQATVDRLFQQFLHRNADPGGKMYFGNLLAMGQVRDEQIAVMLTDSPEYFKFF
jgi:hypothetical protein